MINNFNKAMKYIDQNLENEVDFKKVSQIAGVSEFHFRKIFSYLSGMTLSSYIRKRKMLNKNENVECIYIIYYGNKLFCV